jgi:hypothetical protein
MTDLSAIVPEWRNLGLDEIAQRLASLPKEERDEIVKVATEFTAGMKWYPQPGPQMQAFFSPADILFFGGQAGGGKGLRKQELVLTPFGWRPIGALKVGSAICATDGTVQRVIGYYPRGEQPLFKLTWSDGSETVCDSDHIWLGWISRGYRKIGNVITCGEASAAKWTTQMIYDHFVGKSGAKRSRFSIPVISAPAAFNVHGENCGSKKHISRTVPPYILGVLLGDGSLTANSVLFSSADDEIAERVEELVQSAFGDDVQISRYENADRICKNYRIPNSLFLDDLKDLGLMGHGAATKFIPRIYLFATVEERWELLRGLMDTDGWAEDDGDCYYTSVSKRLAEDVRHLARSLGAVVTWREKIPTYGYLGKKLEGQRAYTLRIKMRDPQRMFSLERKRDLCADCDPQHMSIFLENIEAYGREETVCIAVSHPNSLFVIDNFIVTHNTDLSLGLAMTAHKRSLILREQYVELSFLTDRAIKMNGTRAGFNGV